MGTGEIGQLDIFSKSFCAWQCNEKIKHQFCEFDIDQYCFNTYMSLRLEIKKKMMERSPRVKAIDFHNQNTWVVFGLYSGTLSLYDYSSNTSIKTLQASTFPIRTVKFLSKKHWVISGSDDFQIRVFNYHTTEKVKSFEAHGDFIRAILVHPTEPYLISCSDDTKIKIWNYEKDFALQRTLDEHKHFVLTLAFNPKDLTKFASGSMDKTVKIWNLNTEGKANMTISGHKSSVNTIDFYKGDRPHFATGSDDKTIKIWDYQTKQCLATIESHTMPVTAVYFHPELPIIFSMSEDGKSIIHHSNSYNILNTLEYNLGMGWATSVSSEDRNIIAFGFDEGSVIIKIGSDDPVVSISNGKIIWTKSMEVYSANLKAVEYDQLTDGEKVSLDPKELGTTEIYPTYLKHSPNSHHFGLCNRKEFIVIKTASFKTVISGSGTNLVWKDDSDFAVLDNEVITIYKNFEKGDSVKLAVTPHRIFEGNLLGVSDAEKTIFCDWDNPSAFIHRIDLSAQKIWWDEQGQQMALATETKFVLFQYNKKNKNLSEILTINDKITSGIFVDKIFYYINKAGKIHFSLLGKSFFFSSAEKKQFILGALEQQERLYLFDKNNYVYSHYIPFELFKQVRLFIEGKGSEPEIPKSLRDRIAKCYHGFDLKKQAFRLTENQDHKFELALQLNMVREAHKIAVSTQSTQKIKMIGDLSLKKGEIELAIECYKRIDDLNTLLMIYSSLQLPKQLEELAVRAEQLTKMNVAYTCYYLTNQPEQCLNILIKSKRFSEAALFARTYLNEKVSECVKLWKQSLLDETITNKISDPNEYEQEQQQQEQEGEQQVEA